MFSNLTWSAFKKLNISFPFMEAMYDFLCSKNTNDLSLLPSYNSVIWVTVHHFSCPKVMQWRTNIRFCLGISKTPEKANRCVYMQMTNTVFIWLKAETVVNKDSKRRWAYKYIFYSSYYFYVKKKQGYLLYFKMLFCSVAVILYSNEGTDSGNSFAALANGMQ